MTNTATHTPGPWHSDWQFIVAPDATGNHPDVYIAEICEEDSDGRVVGEEEQKANARLIAAAPELLAALDDLEAEASAEIDPWTTLNLAILKARTVLAKARGE